MDSKMQALFSLEGRVAVVTGGAGALGAPMARGLSQAGAAVAVLDREGARARTLADEIASGGRKALAIGADVTDETALCKARDAVLKILGPVDVLVNCAAIPPVGEGIGDGTMEDFCRVLYVNVGGTFLATRVFGQPMCGQRRGSVINISSLSAHVANHPLVQPSYNASKAAVRQFTQCMALEWAPYGVRCNSVSPGHMTHCMAGNLFPESGPRHDAVMTLSPFGRVGLPVDLGGAVVYLASDASSFTSGIDSLIDGAYHAW